MHIVVGLNNTEKEINVLLPLHSLSDRFSTRTSPFHHQTAGDDLVQIIHLQCCLLLLSLFFAQLDTKYKHIHTLDKSLAPSRREGSCLVTEGRLQEMVQLLMQGEWLINPPHREQRELKILHHMLC